MNLLEAIILGATQGISEWLPISSEGLTVLLGVNFFDGITATELIRLSLYLHFGTFMAALIYFRRDVLNLLKDVFRYRKLDKGQKNTVNFYIVATLVSGAIGLALLRAIEGVEGLLDIESTGRIIMIALGFLLLVTGIFQLKSSSGGERSASEATLADGLITGIAQGFSVLPGLSRSGLTVSTLLLRNFKDTHSLKLSFILSLPIVFVGNILLNTTSFVLTAELFVALFLSFILGLSTIHVLLKLAERIQFGWFVLIFAALVFVAAFV